ncbi:MAG TPA: O-antigen ligase family protein [Gaiellaceae bacterium]|nr:O-antigen ligase family protein [Gaiellaceae bacterium]
MTGAASTHLRRWVAPGVLVLTIVAFAAGSSSVRPVAETALTLRWAALFALVVVALAIAGTDRASIGRLGSIAWLAALPAGFLALAALSTAWSADPPLTFARAGSFGLVLTATAGLALGLDREGRMRVLAAIPLGAGIVAVLGLALWVVSPDYAVQQQPTSASPWRFRGFGENPNTAAMLYAIALPVAGWLALEARSRVRRAVASGAVALFYVGIVLAQSRGALLAAFFGMTVLALALVRGVPRKAGAVGLVALVFVAGNAVRTVNTPEIAPPPPREQFVPAERPAGEPGAVRPVPTPAGEEPGTIEVYFPRFRGRLDIKPADEIGHPMLTDARGVSLGSGRLDAWIGALDLVADRPLLGHGFGTEPVVFVDRWYVFQGGYVENSYIGILLQLGGVGLALFAAFGLFLLARGVRGLRRAPVGDRGLVAACLATVVAGAGLMLVQSFVYSVGNVATVSFWTAAFVLAVATARTEPDDARRPA